MDNIIQFPQKQNSPFPNSEQQSLEHIDEVRRSYCDEVTADAIEALFSVMSSYGLRAKPDELSIKTIVFLEESVRSMIYATKDLNHTFQDLADVAIVLDNDAKKELDRIIEENSLPS